MGTNDLLVTDDGDFDAVTHPLFEAAQRHGGEYEGWGCSVEG